jgi:HAT1-interacting factor 1
LGLSAPELAAKALDKELDARTSSTAAPVVVVDLTSMVKKKKKVPPLEDSNSGKRKAEGETETSPIEKKAKLDTPES